MYKHTRLLGLCVMFILKVVEAYLFSCCDVVSLTAATRLMWLDATSCFIPCLVSSVLVAAAVAAKFWVDKTCLNKSEWIIVRPIAQSCGMRRGGALSASADWCFVAETRRAGQSRPKFYLLIGHGSAQAVNWCAGVCVTPSVPSATGDCLAEHCASQRQTRPGHHRPNYLLIGWVSDSTTLVVNLCHGGEIDSRIGL